MKKEWKVKKERRTVRSWECTQWGGDKRRCGSVGTERERYRKKAREWKRGREWGGESLAVHWGSWCAISNPSCSWLCAVAQQEVGAGQTTINKRAVKNTISHQWPTTGLCACHHGDGTTPLYPDYKTLFYTSLLSLSISPSLLYRFPFPAPFSSVFFNYRPIFCFRFSPSVCCIWICLLCYTSEHAHAIYVTWLHDQQSSNSSTNSSFC